MILRLHASALGIPLAPLRYAKGEIPRAARNDRENAQNDGENAGNDSENARNDSGGDRNDVVMHITQAVLMVVFQILVISRCIWARPIGPRAKARLCHCLRSKSLPSWSLER